MTASSDIERGVHHRSSKPGSSAVARPGMPLLRRRKGLVLIICFSLLCLLVLNIKAIPGGPASVNWMKDAVRPNHGNSAGVATPSGPLPNDFGLNAAGVAAGQGSHQPFAESATDALKKLAEAQGLKASDLEKTILPGTPPSASDHTLLFLEAISNPTYEVPANEAQWRKQLLPVSERDFASSLRKLTPQDGTQEASSFITNRSRWSATQLARHPLTVFSKSYCPYSKRAKELLHSMGAHVQVIEVDTRPNDSHSLQQALAAISGHHTFPTIFVQDRLIGGSDDLQSLATLGVLSGMLKGAGAL